MEILEYAGDRIDVLIGHDEVVVNALAGGASGMILASAQVYPEIWQIVLAAVARGDLETARRYQRQVQKLSRIFCRYGGAVAVKQALRMLGVDAGQPRLPLKGVGGALLHEDRAEIQLELEKLGKLDGPAADFRTPSGPLESRFLEIGLDQGIIRSEKMRTGSGAAGTGTEAVQVDLLYGGKNGPAGEAWAYQLTYPRHGFEALTVILEPNLTVRPSSLIIPTNALRDLRQANMIYGPVQNAVAKALVSKLADGVIPQECMSTDVVFVLTTVHPRALDRRVLHHNAYEAARAAIDVAFAEVEAHG
jgi:formaldehyde-activating enzyme